MDESDFKELLRLIDDAYYCAAKNSRSLIAHLLSMAALQAKTEFDDMKRKNAQPEKEAVKR